MTGQVWRGTVTRAAGGGLFVKVARFGTGEYGPVTYVKHRTGASTWTSPPKPGDRVLVAVVEGSMDELVVLGVIA